MRTFNHGFARIGLRHASEVVPVFELRVGYSIDRVRDNVACDSGVL